MNTSTRPHDPNEPIFLTNIGKDCKDAVLKAIAATGQKVEWRDEPNEKMPANMRADYGSLWSSEPKRDCSKFWREFDRLRGVSRAETQDVLLTMASALLAPDTARSLSLSGRSAEGWKPSDIRDAVWEILSAWRPGMSHEVKHTLSTQIVERVARKSDTAAPLVTDDGGLSETSEGQGGDVDFSKRKPR